MHLVGEAANNLNLPLAERGHGVSCLTFGPDKVGWNDCECEQTFQIALIPFRGKGRAKVNVTSQLGIINKPKFDYKFHLAPFRFGFSCHAPRVNYALS